MRSTIIVMILAVTLGPRAHALDRRGEDTADSGPPARRLVVVDTNGAVVGTILDRGSFGSSTPDLDDLTGIARLWVVTGSLGRDPVALLVRRDALERTFSGIFYERNDCSGMGLIPQSGGALLPTAFAGPFGDPPTILYFPVGPATKVQAASHVIFPFTQAQCTGLLGIFLPPDHCCLAGDLEGFFAPFGTKDVSALGLVSPFHVELR